MLICNIKRLVTGLSNRNAIPSTIFVIKGIPMKPRLLVSLTLTLAVLGSSAAFAQYRGGPYYIDHGPQYSDDWDYYGNDDDGHGRDHGGYSHYDNGPGNGHGNGHAYGHRYHWARGQRLPDEYRRNQYVVNDWRSRRLRQPPRGYQWVQADNQYVLVAVATGIIADLILNAR